MPDCELHSVYHWAGQVVPEQSSPFISYACGWSNFVGNAAGDASFASAFASILNATIIISGHSGLALSLRVLISILITLLWSLLNILRIDRIGSVLFFAAFLQVSTLVLIVGIVLANVTKLNPTSYVFSSYHNETGFDNKAYVIIISLLSSLYGFSGYEASAHMAEETSGASRNAPRGMILTVLASGIVGLGYLLVLLYSTTDIDGAINGGSTNAAIQVFDNLLGRPWTIVISCLLLTNVFFAGLSSVAVTARITFALVRDNAFPFSSYFAVIYPIFQTPLRAILAVSILNAGMLLLPLNADGQTAFVSITGVSTVGFQISYMIPILCKAIFQSIPLPYTDMSLGSWSFPCGAVSSLWLLTSSLIFFLPTSSPVTSKNMNYTGVVVVCFICVAMINWFLYSKYIFKGPRRAEYIGKCRLNVDTMNGFSTRYSTFKYAPI